MFRQYGVHFIAVANNIDSDEQESSEFAPFLNIMNEWYLRDQSKKVAAAYRVKGKAGKPTSNSASSVCLVAISGAPFRLTAHLWQFHYTTFPVDCQPIIANQPQNFIFHEPRHADALQVAVCFNSYTKRNYSHYTTTAPWAQEREVQWQKRRASF